MVRSPPLMNTPPSRLSTCTPTKRTPAALLNSSPTSSSFSRQRIYEPRIISSQFKFARVEARVAHKSEVDLPVP